MSLYTKEELEARRAAAKAERARKKELLKGKTKEEKREIERQLAQEKLAKDTAAKITRLNDKSLQCVKDMIAEVAADAMEKRAKELADKKLKKFCAKIEDVKNGKPFYNRSEISFTVPQLVRIFGGWFTLQYIFTAKTGVMDENGNEMETDFYVCSKDVALMKETERPKRNEAVFNAFGVVVYGYAIIAPASAF